GRRAGDHPRTIERSRRANRAPAAEGLAPQRKSGAPPSSRSRQSGYERNRKSRLVFGEPFMAVTEKKYHVGLGPGDVGDYVLVPGDPFRTPLISKYLDDAREVAFSREYRTFTGTLDWVPVS